MTIFTILLPKMGVKVFLISYSKEDTAVALFFIKYDRS